MYKNDNIAIGDDKREDKTNRDSPKAFPIPTIKVDFTPDISCTSTPTWSSMTVSLPPTDSSSSSQSNLLTSPYSRSFDNMRMSTSEPVLIEKEGKLIFQSNNNR